MAGGGKTTTTGMDPLQKEFISDYIMPVADEIRDDVFTGYDASRTAGLTDLQRDSLKGYGELSLPSEYTEAGDIYRDVANLTPDQIAQTKSGYAQEYMDAILDPTRARLRREQQQQVVGDEGNLIRSNAFGNERRGVYEAERDVAQNIEMANLEAGIARDAYGAADARFGQEVGLRTGAAGSLASLGGTKLGNQLNILGAGMTAGEAERAITQDELDKAYEEFMREEQYPLMKLAGLTGGASAFPAGIGTTTTRDPLGSAGNILTALGAFGQGGGFNMFSDVRLKKNITPYADLRGVKFYKWEWNAKANKKGLYGADIGVLAHEIEETRPHLVSASEDGYKKVNYDQLYAEIS